MPAWKDEGRHDQACELDWQLNPEYPGPGQVLQQNTPKDWRHNERDRDARAGQTESHPAKAGRHGPYHERAEQRVNASRSHGLQGAGSDQ